jgi:ubiquinone/menaquinone biosynthesis C-methylase UbiE
MSKEGEWFETWFDSEYYHILYSNRDDQEASIFIQKLLSNLHLKPGSQVLDLACGKGRHALSLFKNGMQVTGIDLSKNSIKTAKQHEQSGLRFHAGDMRYVHFPNSFHAVFNFFTSFGYFSDVSDNFLVLKAVHQQLMDDGLFVIDYFNLNQVLASIEVDAVDRKTINGIQFESKKRTDEHFIIKEISIDDPEHGQFRFEERVQRISLDDFKIWLEEAGFSIQTIYGSYELEEYSSGSDRCILIAKKK